jgi:anti-sigma factor RsiW
MTAHLSSATLNALVDQELSADQAAAAKEHLDHCPACTSSALTQALLKTAVTKAGQRYAAGTHLQERLRRLASQQIRTPSQASGSGGPSSRAAKWVASPGWRAAWAIAAMLLVIAAGWISLQRHAQRSTIASVQTAALVSEMSDLHIATLAANQPPQVISSDRHTVKPWFQGKLPFSFNLPDNLPADTRLDGANLTYLDDRPVAQLLYSIGRHRVSVIVRQKRDTASNPPKAEQSGFHVTGTATDDLEIIAISDVDPGRLSALLHAIEQAQTRHG